MDLAIKGLLGALVAISLHFAANSKHFYLTGLIPLFPTFALLAHTLFAASGRTTEIQISAQFGLLSLLPYGVYLLLAWFLIDRINIWWALAVSTIGWATVATVIILVWHK